jgi:deoxyribodipyrimidine photolyase-related protein
MSRVAAVAGVRLSSCMPAKRTKPAHLRNLVLVLGDQSNAKSAAFDDFDPECDAVWMVEVAEEATHVWTHKARIVLFLAAMRHFRDDLQKSGIQVHYTELDASNNSGSFASELARAVRTLQPTSLVVVEPGEYRVREALAVTARELAVPLEFRADRHFFCTPEEFGQHARGRKQLRMEYFYREMRRKTGVLMDGPNPCGGEWNFDTDNRGSFGKSGPGALCPEPVVFSPDAITREVMKLVERRFPQHPGSLARFDWPLTPEQAHDALTDFVEHRLPSFGRYQDAMWSDEPYLYHSRLSTALNLKLLDPRTVIAAVEKEYQAGRVEIAAAEGFVRQILGWREYVRGVYWLHMPEYLERNELGAAAPLPQFYWTGDTEMNCLRQAIGQTLKYGYAHHIQRLMVTGLFALLFGVNPKAVHEWYLAVYVDAVEWVELPNTLGMSQFADDGVMASKPYCASGKYINRMSNYCEKCRYDPAKSTGADACPFTTLYWDFLARHRDRLAANPRTVMQIKNLDRFSSGELKAITDHAKQIRVNLL